METERRILSTILVDPLDADRFLEEIDPEWFFDNRVRQAFELCRHYNKTDTPFEIGDLATTLKNQNPDVIWGAFLSDVMDEPVSVNDVILINALRGEYLMRRAQRLCSEFISTDHIGDSIEVVAELVRQVVTLQIETNDSFVDAVGLASETYNLIEDRVTKQQSPGLPLGFRHFDNVCNIRGPLLILLAGRPSMGKTALMLTMMRTMLNRGHKIGAFSMEMSRTSLAQRWAQMDTGHSTVNMNKFEGLTGKELKEVENSYRDMSSMWGLMMDDQVNTIESIMRKARRMKRLGAEAIFIDQLSKISGGAGKDTERYTRHCNLLAELKKELNIPIFLLAQINRTVEQTSTKEPSLSHLKQTGSLEEDADMIFLIHRPEYYAQNDEERAKHAGKVVVNLAKHRDGETCRNCDVQFIKHRGMFTDVAREIPQEAM